MFGHLLQFVSKNNRPICLYPLLLHYLIIMTCLPCAQKICMQAVENIHFKNLTFVWSIHHESGNMVCCRGKLLNRKLLNWNSDIFPNWSSKLSTLSLTSPVGFVKLSSLRWSWSRSSLTTLYAASSFSTFSTNVWSNFSFLSLYARCLKCKCQLRPYLRIGRQRRHLRFSVLLSFG